MRARDPDRLTPLIGCLRGHFGASFDGAPGTSRSGRLTYKDGKTAKLMQRRQVSQGDTSAGFQVVPTDNTDILAFGTGR